MLHHNTREAGVQVDLLNQQLRAKLEGLSLEELWLEISATVDNLIENRQPLMAIFLLALFIVGCRPDNQNVPTVTAAPGAPTLPDAPGAPEAAPSGERTTIVPGTVINMPQGGTLFEISQDLINASSGPVPTPRYNADEVTHNEQWTRQILTTLLVQHIIDTNNNITDPRTIQAGEDIQLPSAAEIRTLRDVAENQVRSNLNSYLPYLRDILPKRI